MKKTTFLKTMLLATVMLAGSASVWGQYTGTGTFTKITSLSDLEDGYYVIVNSGDAWAMNNSTTQVANCLGNTSVAPSGGKITNPSTTIVWKIEVNATGRTIYNEASTKYVSYTGSSNNVQVADAVSANNQRWTFSYSSNAFRATNAAVTGRSLQYNNGSPRFACYTNSQQDLLLYKMEVSTSCTSSEFSFGETTITKSVADAAFTKAASSLNTTTAIAYSSSKPSVATINAATGAVTIVSTGTTVITATQAAGTHSTIEYCEGTAFYELTVEPLAIPVASEATSVGITSFTANWAAVTGATGYEVDVYTKVGNMTTILSENFEGFTAGQPNASAHGTNIVSDLDNYTQTEGWTGALVYQAGGTAKMGTASALGSFVTPSINLSAHEGAFTVSFDAMAWSGDSTKLKIYLNDALAYTVTGLNNDATYTLLPFSVDLTGGTATSTIKFEANQASRGRFFLDNIVITQGAETLTPITGSPFTVTGATSKEITGLSPETTYYYTVTAKAGEFVSAKSNEISATTQIATGKKDVQTLSFNVCATNGTLFIEGVAAGTSIEVYNSTGQRLTSAQAIGGMTTIDVSTRGIVLVKVGKQIVKVAL